MKAGSYAFEVGEFECVSLSDGYSDYPLENFFANVPEEKVQKVLESRHLPTDHIRTPYTYLFVNTGQNRVLVDMGAGSLSETTGHLPASMQKAGIDPGKIDYVIITHAHPDHVGGLLDADGKPLVPNARYYIARIEWDFWFSEEQLAKASGRLEKFFNLARAKLAPVKDRVELVDFTDHKADILPGISVLYAPGHTPGHLVAAFSSAGEKLYYIGDTVLYPLHLEYTDWKPVYDILPVEAEQSKHRIFDLAATEKAWVMGQHFPPFPSLGHVVKKQQGWQWQPVVSAG